MKSMRDFVMTELLGNFLLALQFKGTERENFYNGTVQGSMRMVAVMGYTNEDIMKIYHKAVELHAVKQEVIDKYFNQGA